MAEKLLRPKDVAAILGVSVERANQMMREMRRIPISKNPNGPKARYAVTESELTRWQNASMIAPQTAVVTPKRKAQPIYYDPKYFEPDGRIKRR